MYSLASLSVPHLVACLAQVPALGLDEEAQALFLWKNAARVFGLDVAE